MQKIRFILFFILLHTGLCAQDTLKIVVNPEDKHSASYTIFFPDSAELKGYLILIPAFGETQEAVSVQTALPRMAAKNGILTVIPTFRTGTQAFGIDSLSQASLQEIIKDVQRRYLLAHWDMYIGGFSIGGSSAIKYAERAQKEPGLFKPKAVFAIDPPLDFERFYQAALRSVRLAGANKPNPESVYMIQRIKEEMGGTPEAVPHQYHRLSPYSFSDTTQRAVKCLVNTPLRIYCEPDIQWWMQERSFDLSNMNVTDAAAMINELNRLGNKKASLILTQDKGFRNPDKKKHPHSWSIVDNQDLINWLLAQ
ncbi:alpha/beta hydrolase [Taibaiella sp. KBW10]|uniref:alpha/beta hydrolase n=1 Tax=Taibaiella sp. KBW10 TaxID=2153357 RepID=UPI000F5A7B00|nr:alpha/beta hydrolase [Taibaiella sp. KBW10]RQO30213.1 alpha/beta hydrolase [Taibaiella sp. KBW10]